MSATVALKTQPAAWVGAGCFVLSDSLCGFDVQLYLQFAGHTK